MNSRSLFIFNRSRKLPFLFCLITLMLISVNSFSQDLKRVEIVQANSLEGSKINGQQVRRLNGDVRINRLANQRATRTALRTRHRTQRSLLGV